MRLYIMRHGEALSEAIDSRCPLSEEGVKDVNKVGEFLKRSNATFDLIWHSGKARAKDTAERIRDCVDSSIGCHEVPNLKPNDPVKPVRDAINKLSELGHYQSLLIAGHLPSVSRLVSLIMTGEESKAQIGFATGTVVCLEEQEKGSFILEWVISPEDLG